MLLRLEADIGRIETRFLRCLVRFKVHHLQTVAAAARMHAAYIIDGGHRKQPSVISVGLGLKLDRLELHWGGLNLIESHACHITFAAFK